jgi:hypothetical protein
MTIKRYDSMKDLALKVRLVCLSAFRARLIDYNVAMGERHKNAEKSSVRLCAVAHSRPLLMRDMAATKIYPKLLVILTERRRRLLFCWQAVCTRIFLCCTSVCLAIETVQSRDLASAMRSALTTHSLADCASLILKTVSMATGSVYCLES